MMMDRLRPTRHPTHIEYEHLATGARFVSPMIGHGAGEMICTFPAVVQSMDILASMPVLRSIVGARAVDLSADVRYNERRSDGTAWQQVVVPPTPTPASTWALRGSGVAGDQRRITDIGNQPNLLVMHDGTRWQPQGGQQLVYSLGAELVSAASTAASVSLPGVTIPAGLLGLSGGLMIEFAAELDATPSARNLQLTLAGQTIIADTTAGGQRSVYLARHLRNTGVANAQRLMEPLSQAYGTYGSVNVSTPTLSVNTGADAILSGSVSWTSAAAQVARLSMFRVWWIA